jgi:hypothetical protein
VTVPAALPVLPGLAWSRHKKPGFSTRVASHVSGREVRVALMSSPLYEFEAIYDGLASSSAAAFAGLGSTSLQNLMGFFLQLLGQAGNFLYTDPDDSTVAGQFVATGDGATLSFVMSRTLGGFNEPVAWVTNVTNVYLNGVAQASSSWVFTAPNSIGFYSAPAAGVAITADFSYAFQCRFLDDQMDFEEFMSSLWKLDSMKFRSIKANITAAPPPAWYNLYAIGGAAPTLFADPTTEAGTDHYYYNGSTYSGFAALLAACGIVFTRSSTATYTNSSGQLVTAASGVLRFDYSLGGAPLGVLLEGASTNVCQQSGSLATSPWANQYASVGGTTSGPTGSSSDLDLIIPSTTSTTSHATYQGISFSAATYTAGMWAKAGGYNYLAVNFSSSGGYSGVVFNLSAGTIVSTSAGYSGSITSWGGGLYRIMITKTLAAGTNYLYLCPFNAAGGSAYPGDGVSGVYVGLVQVEQLPFASSYIPTTSGSATRAADAFTAAAWPAPATGTLYVKGDTAYAGQMQRLIEIDDGTVNNRASLSFNASAAVEFDLLSGGSSEAALTAGAIAAGTQVQMAAAFAANDFALVEAGGTPAAASSGTIPVLSKLRIGADASGANNLFGHISQFGVWNGTRAPNTTLQSLT